MRVSVLGPVEVEVDGRLLDLGARKQRSLLAVLCLHRGRPVSVGAIAEALWGDEPPASHAVTLQGYVSDLRKVLEPTRAPRSAATVVLTTPTGYQLAIPPEAFDTVRLDDALRAASEAFPRSADEPWRPLREPDPDRLVQAAEGLDLALAGWRGEPYADLPDEVARAERARLHETRTTAIELREAIRLHLGDAVEASRRLEPLVLEEPYRERLHLLQAVALVQAGRQVEAMALLRQLRTTLREDLGIDPGPAVAALETAVLQGRLEGGRPRPSADVRVVLVDDHPVFRMGMSGLLSSLEGLEVAAVVGDADAARAAVDESVDVVLMDLDLGGDSGIDLTAELTAQYPDLQVLVMTMHDEDSFVRAALAAGAAGYLVKSAEPDDVHRAIRAVAAGELVVGAQVARAARSHLGGAHRGRP
ncbi:BTAD domain-containing putative transcriptional regulator [Nocardioides sp. J54]|uniref:BTAD domain-containing putative transcriptional regulator n=1 Tax=Nocardioides sp. J54 TaxID=935866 RepID=UPI0004ADFBE0|nr:BTAD domain-containing putative transcriptional regulator [Nocardioides sp. J54]